MSAQPTLLAHEASPPTTRRRRPSGRAAVTFEGGLDAPFHRWFRLTPSFSPILVENWLERMGVSPEATLLDPFAGAATTCIVGKRRGMRSIGIEINPFLAFVGNTSLDWSVAGDEVRSATAAVIAEASELLETRPGDPEQFCRSLGVEVPPIHDIDRWWHKSVLREILAIRSAIDRVGGAASDHMRLALAEIVYSTAKITLGRLQIAFVDRAADGIDVLKPFEEAAGRISADLATAVPTRAGSAEVLLGDSTEMVGIDDSSIDAVFTSPPYPNRYSYVWNTRPHLYLLEFITTASEAGDLDCRTIGGTWGKATSVLQKSPVELAPNVETVAGAQLHALRAESLLMGNYVGKYFNDLDRHLRALRPKLKPGAPIGYVVGNTETKGIMIETHEILGRLMELNGFTDLEHEHLRSRNSGVGLVEVAVSATA